MPRIYIQLDGAEEVLENPPISCGNPIMITPRGLAQTFGFFSETRPSWTVPQNRRRRICWVAAFTGAWGILTGFAIFLLVSQEIDMSESQYAVWKLLAVVVVAVAVVSIIEWLRELIHEGTSEGHKRTVISILISVLLLGMFELCVVAYEEVSKSGMEDSSVLLDVTQRITSYQRQDYGFLPTLGLNQANVILYDVINGAQWSNPNPWMRVAEFAPEDLRGLVEGTQLKNNFPKNATDKQWFEFYSAATEPIWHAWLPWLKEQAETEFGPHRPVEYPALMVVAGTEEWMEISSLRLMLNRISTRLDFYQREYFQFEPFLFNKNLLRAQAELEDQQHTRGELEEVEGQLKEHSLDLGLQWKQRRLLSRLLPLQEIIRRNQELIQASFPVFPNVPLGVASKAAPPVNGWNELATLGVIWILAGAVIGWVLGELLFRTTGKTSRRAVSGGAIGVLAALAVAPSAVILWTLYRRFISSMQASVQSFYSVWGLNPYTMDKGLNDFLWKYRRLELIYYSSARLRVILLKWFIPHNFDLVLGCVLCLMLLLVLWSGRSQRRPAAWTYVYILLLLMIRLNYITWNGHPIVFGGSLKPFVAVVCLLIVWAEVRWKVEYPTDYIGWFGVALLTLPYLDYGLAYANTPLTFFPLVCSVVASVVWRWKKFPIGKWLLTIWLLNAAIFLLLEVYGNLWDLFRMVGLVWIIPAALLGATVPYLKPGSALPKTWGAIGLLVGLSLVGVTALRFQELWWVSIPGGLLVLTGVLIYSGWHVEEFWPLAALSMGLLVSGWTFVFQQATFGNALAGFFAAEPSGRTLDDELQTAFLQRPDLRPDEIQLKEFGEAFKKQAAEDEKLLQATKRVVAERLELSIVGSFGFWSTIGLLAGWAVFRGQRQTLECGDERSRCFWAREGLHEYHDTQYGVLPHDDAELFRRFSLELLMDDRYHEESVAFERAFHGFELRTVAGMNPAEVRAEAEQASSAEERKALSQGKRIKMVIENANRFLAQLDRSEQDAPSNNEILKTWQGLAGENDGNALIAYLRSTYEVPMTLPLKTVLEALGILPSAHVPGCYLNMHGSIAPSENGTL
jgi:Methyladenine glycosylase